MRTLNRSLALIVSGSLAAASAPSVSAMRVVAIKVPIGRVPLGVAAGGAAVSGELLTGGAAVSGELLNRESPVSERIDPNGTSLPLPQSSIFVAPGRNTPIIRAVHAQGDPAVKIVGARVDHMIRSADIITSQGPMPSKKRSPSLGYLKNGMKTVSRGLKLGTMQANDALMNLFASDAADKGSVVPSFLSNVGDSEGDYLPEHSRLLRRSPVGDSEGDYLRYGKTGPSRIEEIAESIAMKRRLSLDNMTARQFAEIMVEATEKYRDHGREQAPSQEAFETVLAIQEQLNRIYDAAAGDKTYRELERELIDDLTDLKALLEDAPDMAEMRRVAKEAADDIASRYARPADRTGPGETGRFDPAAVRGWALARVAAGAGSLGAPEQELRIFKNVILRMMAHFSEIVAGAKPGGTSPLRVIWNKQLQEDGLRDAARIEGSWFLGVRRARRHLRRYLEKRVQGLNQAFGAAIAREEHGRRASRELQEIIEEGGTPVYQLLVNGRDLE